MSKKFLLAVLAVLCAVSPSLAQTQFDDVVRITTNLVQIDAVVRRRPSSNGVDASGLQVTSMSAADSTLRPMVSGSQGNGLFAQQLRDRSKLIQSRRDGANMIAKETGGFLVYDQNEFQLDKILDEQGGYYLIGYRPSTETFNKKFHKLKARVKTAGFELRTRFGFFGMSEEEAKQLKETTKQ